MSEKKSYRDNDDMPTERAVLEREWKAMRLALSTPRAALAAQPGSVPEGWKDVIDRVRDSMEHDQPSGYPGGNSGYREYAGCILDAVCDELDAIAAAPTEAKPAQDAVDARPLTTGELADVTAPWAHIWTDQSFGIANAAIDKFCEVNGIQRAAISAKKGGA